MKTRTSDRNELLNDVAFGFVLCTYETVNAEKSGYDDAAADDYIACVCK